MPDSSTTIQEQPETFTVVWQGACEHCQADHHMASRVAIEGYDPSFEIYCLNCESRMTMEGRRIDVS